VQNIAEFAHSQAMLNQVEPPSHCRTGEIWQKETPAVIEVCKGVKNIRGNIRLLVVASLMRFPDWSAYNF